MTSSHSYLYTHLYLFYTLPVSIDTTHGREPVTSAARGSYLAIYSFIYRPIHLRFITELNSLAVTGK